MRRPTPCRSSATAAEIPALPASQGMTGPIFTGTYGYRGSEIDLIASDILPAGNLSAQTSCCWVFVYEPKMGRGCRRALRLNQ
jgi:hypothetical protein